MAYIGEIRIFGGPTPPSGWALCNGQLLPIVGNSALWSILSNRFGGDGVTNFALPDLRGRTPIGAGQGPGLQARTVGGAGGFESHTLASGQMPSHNHTLRASSALGISDDPATRVMAKNPAAIPTYDTTAGVDLAAGAVAAAGGGQPHNNMQPYLALSYIIALQGDMPSPA